MNKKELLKDFITKMFFKEYSLIEVRRSNYDEKQEYDFVIKKVPSEGTNDN